MREQTNMNSCFDYSYLQLEKGSPIFSLPEIVCQKVYYRSGYHTSTSRSVVYKYLTNAFELQLKGAPISLKFNPFANLRSTYTIGPQYTTQAGTCSGSVQREVQQTRQSCHSKYRRSDLRQQQQKGQYGSHSDSSSIEHATNHSHCDLPLIDLQADTILHRVAEQNCQNARQYTTRRSLFMQNVQSPVSDTFKEITVVDYCRIQMVHQKVSPSSL